MREGRSIGVVTQGAGAPVYAGLLRMDERTLPRLAAYLADLPDGLDSYPECRSKASLHRAFLDEKALPPLAPGALPEPVRELVEAPAAVSSWIPTVVHHSVLLVVRELCFEDDESYCRHAFESQRKIFRGPMYRLLLVAMPVDTVLRGIAYRWKAFHQGTQLEVLERGDGEAHLRLRYPPRLYNELGLLGLASGFRAALDAMKATDPKVEVTEMGEGEAHFRGTWRGQ